MESNEVHSTLKPAPDNIDANGDEFLHDKLQNQPVLEFKLHHTHIFTVVDGAGDADEDDVKNENDADEDYLPIINMEIKLHKKFITKTARGNGERQIYGQGTTNTDKESIGSRNNGHRGHSE